MNFLKFHPRFSGNRDSGANLKKVLALVLAFACAFTMFAGAAFTDQADIKVKDEVVDTLVELGVIEGFEDGSFQPNATVTRAQMAKMIYVLRTGNSDASAYNDDKTSFTDIGSHWARGYIKYCQSLGIIAGKSSTIFAPNANVTAQEAAKMLLVTLGYDATKAGLTGAGWASKTNALADEAGLLEDVNTSFTAACPRQYAAQLIYNTIFAKTVVLRDGEYTKYGYDNTPNPTVGEKFMGLEEFTGIFNGNDNVVTTLKEGEIQITGTTDDDNYTAKATYKMNNDLIGEEVTVLYRDHKNGTDGKLDTKDTVFGVYATGETTVYNITSGDLQDGDNAKIKFNDKEYKAAAKINVIENYIGTGTKTDVKEFGKVSSVEGKYYGDYPTTIKFIAKDGEITSAYVNTFTLARVTAVNSTKVSINNGVGTVEFEDNDIYDGIKKDDIVVVQTFYNKDADNDDARTTVTKAEVQSGKLDGYKGTEKVTFGGNTYTVAGGEFAPTTIDSDFETSVADQIGETYDFYFIGDYVAAVKMTSDGTKNYAVVTGVTGVANNKANPLKAALKKADGSEVTVELDTDGIVNVNQDDLVKYSETNSTKYKIKDKVSPSTNNSKVYDKDTKCFDGVVTSADAPLFVRKGNDYYVYTIRNLNDVTAAGQASKIVDDSKVVAAYVTLNGTPSGASSDTVYGIVSAAKGSVKIDDTYYTQFAVDTFNKAGDAETNKKVLVEGTSSKLSKGDLVSFDVAANDIYQDGDIDVWTDGATADNKTAATAWVKEYDAKGEILTTWDSIVKNGSAYEGKDGDITVTAFDDDAVIAYVSVDDEKGTTDNGVPAFDGVKGYKNVMVITENNKIVGLFVDTDNNIENASGTVAAPFKVGTPKLVVKGDTTKYPAKDFEVSQSITEGNDNATVTYTVKYVGTVNDTDDTITVVPTGSAVDGHTSASGNLTGIAKDKTWTCSVTINNASVADDAVVITVTTAKV